MKNIINILVSALLALFIISCEDSAVGPVANPGVGPAITAPTGGTTIELKEATGSDVLNPITWTAAQYGFQAPTQYTLYIDKAGNNFAGEVAVGGTNSLSLSDVTQADLNNILLAMDLEGETPADMQIRVKSFTHASLPELVSDPVNVTVIPYTATVVIPQLQVPGSYQGWDPGNNTTIIYSPKSDNKYEGFIYFQDDNVEFKFTEGPSWDVNWGDDGGDGTLDANGANLKAGAAGVYRLNVDLNNKTYKMVRTDWGVIGSATPGGWDSDQNMTYDAANNKLTITLDLVAGDAKFRANDDWAINFGDDGNNKTLEYDGANIAIADPGNYTLDLLIFAAPKYKYAITKN